MENDYSPQSLIKKPKLSLKEIVKVFSVLSNTDFESSSDIVLAFLAKLKKSLKYDINLKYFLKLLHFINMNKSEISLLLIEAVKLSVTKYYTFPVTFPNCLYFNKEGYQIYKQENDFFSIKDEFSVMMWVYPKFKKSDSIILEISETKKFRATIRLVENSLILSISSQQKIYWAQSSTPIPKKQWNFIAVTIKYSKNLFAFIKINENEMELMKNSGYVKIKANINSMSVGSSLSENVNFQGKIASMMIFKKFCNEECMKFFYNYPCLKVADLGRIKNQTMIQFLEKEIVYSFNSEESVPLLKEKNVNICANVTFFSRSNLIDAIRFFSIFLESVYSDTSNKLFFNFMEIITKVGNVNDCFPNILSEEMIYVVCAKVAQIEYTSELHNHFTNLILSMNLPELKKKFFKFYLGNKSIFNIYEHPRISEIFQNFKNLFKFNGKNVMLLRGLILRQNDNLLQELFAMFQEDINNTDQMIEIFSVLSIIGEFSLIAILIDLIEVNNLKGNYLILFSLLLSLLYKAIPYKLSKKVITIIFNFYLSQNTNHRLSLTIKDNMKKSKEFVEILGFINKNFTEIEIVLDFVFRVKIKNMKFPDKQTKKALFDFIVSQLKNINLSTSFEKLTMFLSENNDKINKYIINSQFFLNSVMTLFEKNQKKASEFIVFIYSRSKKLLSFDKLKKIIIELKNDELSLQLISDLLYNLLDTNFLKSESLFSEFLLIVKSIRIEVCKNSEKYTDLLNKLIDLCIENHFFQFLPLNSIENEAKSEKFLGLILLSLMLKSGHFYPHMINDSFKKYLEHPKFQYFKKSKIPKNDRAIYSIYCFTMLCELNYLNKYDFIEFLENFCIKSEIFDNLITIFQHLKPEDFENSENLLKTSKINSNSLKLIEENKVFAISLDKSSTISLIKSTKSQLFSEKIFSEEWIFNVHLLLLVLITQKWIKKVFPIECNSSVSLPIFPCLDVSELSRKYLELGKKLISKQEKSLFASKFKMKVSKSLRKFGIIKTKLLKTVEKFHLKNVFSKNLCWNIIKLTKESIVIDRSSMHLFRRSLSKCESLIEKYSLLQLSASILQDSTRFERRSMEVFAKSRNIIADCEQIKIKGSYFGRITVSSKYFQFKCDGLKKFSDKYPASALDFTIRSKKCDYIWKKNEISEILHRKFLHKNTAFEVFLESGKSYFFNVFSEQVREEILDYIKNWKTVKVFSSIPYEVIDYYYSKWNSGKTSNFQYLMALNKYAGRSFHDLSQYPVFPWVLSDYSSEFLDLSLPESYRDFNYPIGAQTEASRSDLKAKHGQSENEILGKYHHGSHYSNGGIVLYYLVRIEPFTTQARILHDGNFDVSDRLFFSLQKAWNSNKTDCKEMVPQMFYLPEMFENLNNLEMGQTSLLLNAADVIFPPWAKNSWDFVRKHRKALESAHTSSQLHNWIDLIFGFRQRGKHAEENLNVFCKVTYDDIFLEIMKIVDYEDRDAIIEQAYHFGQTPQHIFKKPHPRRSFVPKNHIFDEIKYGKNILFEKFELKAGRIDEIFSMKICDMFLFIFFKYSEEIQFFRYDLSDKTFLKCKIFQLKGIVYADFYKISFELWKNKILSYGYKDKLTRIHNSDGEILKTLSNKHIILNKFHCSDFLYSADYSIIHAYNENFEVVRKYFGHTNIIKSISTDKERNLIISTDGVSKILIHHKFTEEILLVINELALNVKIAKYGVLLAMNNDCVKAFSMQGKHLWSSKFFINEKSIVNKSGEYVLVNNEGSLEIYDFFENNLIYKGLKRVELVTISKNENYILCVKQGKKNKWGFKVISN